MLDVEVALVDEELHELVGDGRQLEVGGGGGVRLSGPPVAKIIASIAAPSARQIDQIEARGACSLP